MFFNFSKKSTCKLTNILCTHYDGTTAGLAVDSLVAQVEDQCGSAIKESKHTNTHKELSRGGEVTLKEDLFGFTAIT